VKASTRSRKAAEACGAGSDAEGASAAAAAAAAAEARAVAADQEVPRVYGFWFRVLGSGLCALMGGTDRIRRRTCGRSCL